MGISELIHSKHDYVEGPKCTSLNNVEVWLPKANSEGTEEGKWVVYVIAALKEAFEC